MVSGPASTARCPAAALIRESSAVGDPRAQDLFQATNFREPSFNGLVGQLFVGNHGRQKDQGPHVHLGALDHVG